MQALKLYLLLIINLAYSLFQPSQAALIDFDQEDMRTRYQNDLLANRYITDLQYARRQVNQDPQTALNRIKHLVDHKSLASDKYAPLRLAILAICSEASFRLGHYLGQKEFSEIGLKLANTIKSNHYQSVFYAYRAQSKDLLGQTDDALNDFNQAAAIADQLNDTGIQFDVYRLRGDMFSYQGQHQRALEDLQVAYNIYIKNNKSPKYASVLNNLASLYVYMGELSLASDTLNELLTIQKRMDDQFAVATTLYNLGKVEHDSNHYQKAELAYNQSLSISQELNDKVGIAYAKSGLGQLYMQESPLEASQYFKEALTVFQSVYELQQTAQTLIFLAEVQLKLRVPDEALNTLNKAMALMNYMSAPPLVRMAYRLRSEIYAELGDYASAYTAYIDYKKIDDDIYNEERNRQLNQLMVEFETEKQIKENQLLSKSNQLKQLTIEQNKRDSKRLNWIIGLFALLIIILGISVSKLIIISRKLKQLAHTDELSGLPNRRSIFGKSQLEISRCRRHNTPLSLIIFDIDKFKVINDTFGHQIGDAAIQRVSQSCRSLLRNEDAMGRIGGEEFLVLLPHTNHKDAVITAERIRRKIESTDYSDIHAELRVTISLGISGLRADDTHLTELTHRADMALYKAKESGRNCIKTSEKESDLHLAVNNVFRIA
ncbi:MAG: tetratricopeptide repeat-containing diguanylate cyclase [Pseudomonadota bacterium]